MSIAIPSGPRPVGDRWLIRQTFCFPRTFGARTNDAAPTRLQSRHVRRPGPDPPLTSIIGAIGGALMIFWRQVVGIAKRIAGVFKR